MPGNACLWHHRLYCVAEATSDILCRDMKVTLANAIDRWMSVADLDRGQLRRQAQPCIIAYVQHSLVTLPAYVQVSWGCMQDNCHV